MTRRAQGVYRVYAPWWMLKDAGVAQVRRARRVQQVRWVATGGGALAWRAQSRHTSNSPLSGIGPCIGACVTPCREFPPLVNASSWHAAAWQASATSMAELAGPGPRSGARSGPGPPAEVSSARAAVGASAHGGSSAARTSSSARVSILAISASSVTEEHREDLGDEVCEPPATGGSRVDCSPSPAAATAAAAAGTPPRGAGCGGASMCDACAPPPTAPPTAPPTRCASATTLTAAALADGGARHTP